MKNKTILAAVLLVAAVFVRADVEALYWQVTGENNPEPISFTVASFVATDGDTVERLVDSSGNAWQGANSDKVTTEAIASLWDSKYNGDSSGWSFYIELMNWDGSAWTTVGTIDSGSGNWSYDDIKSHIYSSSSMSMSLATPITSGTAHIPEPTSGLLMLVGGALLALRRRRV